MGGQGSEDGFFFWKVGNSRSIKFWEDQWFGGSSLAIQFWPIYVINNEKGITINRAWDGVHLKLTFRRAVLMSLILMWEELTQIACSIRVTENNGDIIWKYDSRGVYSVQYLYAVVNFRGVVTEFLFFCGSFPTTKR